MRTYMISPPKAGCVIAMAVAAFALACGLPSYAQGPSAAVPPPEIAKVTVVAPKQKDLKQSIKLPGNLVPEEQVSLYSKVAGFLDEIKVDEGDVVANGQILAKLSAPEMEPELALAEAKMRAAQSRIGKASASADLEAAIHQRLAKLHAVEPGAVTEEDVEEAAAKDKIAHAEVVTAEAEAGVASAEVQRLKTMLDYLIVRAPFDGTVTQRFADPGAFISAGTGAKPIVEITRVNKLRLVFDLPERLTPFVKKGTRLKFSLAALPGKLFDGAITRRTDTLAPETRSMRAEVDIDNSDGMLAPGMYASVQVPLEGLAGVNVVPASAIRTIDGKVFVLAMENGTVKKMPVETLLDDGPEVVVSGELSPEMKLISQGPASLVDGQRVEVKEAN